MANQEVQMGIKYLSRRTKKNIRIYCNAVSKHLLCSSKTKKRFLTELEFNICDFLTDHPDASIADIQQHFGTPEDISASYLSTLDNDELNKKINKTRKIKKIVMILAAIILFLFTIVYILEIRDNWLSQNRHIHIYVSYTSNVSAY